MSDKITIKKARKLVNTYPFRSPVDGKTILFTGSSIQAEGFIEGYKSRDAEVMELKKIIKNLGAEDCLKEKME